MKIDFVRGHMGGNLIVLVKGEQIPGGRELETGVKLLKPHYLCAHEIGILYPAGRASELTVKIAEPTSECFISACGGFTQVLGAALIETALGDDLGVEKKEPLTKVLLHTEGGQVPLEIETKGNKSLRIKTDMTSFVQESYEKGIGKLKHENLEVMQAGKFLVINADRFKEAYPWADFEKWDQKTRQKVNDIQDQFIAETGEDEYNVVLYDWHPEYGMDLRVVYPHCVKADYFEPSCGTGTVALGLAVLAWDELPEETKERDTVTLKFECGGNIELGGPEITELEMKVENGRVKEAALSHSKVEITAVGEAWL
ncbi:MAG: hypothetical protein R6U91_07335 [Bacillota bacterium]